VKQKKEKRNSRESLMGLKIVHNDWNAIETAHHRGRGKRNIRIRTVLKKSQPHKQHKTF
jgi:hypothetical protein